MLLVISHFGSHVQDYHLPEEVIPAGWRVECLLSNYPHEPDMPQAWRLQPYHALLYRAVDPAVL